MAVIGSFTPNACSISRNRPTAISESPPRSKKSPFGSTAATFSARHQIPVRRAAVSGAIAHSRERHGRLAFRIRDVAKPGAEDRGRHLAPRGEAVGEDREMIHQRRVALVQRAAAEAV